MMLHFKLDLPGMSLNFKIHLSDYLTTAKHDFIIISGPLEQFNKKNKELYRLASFTSSMSCPNRLSSQSLMQKCISPNFVFSYTTPWAIALAIPFILSDRIFPQLTSEESLPLTKERMLSLGLGLATYRKNVRNLEQHLVFENLIKILIRLIEDAPFNPHYNGIQLGNYRDKRVTAKTHQVFSLLTTFQKKPLISRLDLIDLYTKIEQNLFTEKSNAQLCFFQSKKIALEVEKELFKDMLAVLSETVQGSLAEITEEIQLQTTITNDMACIISNYVR